MNTSFLLEGSLGSSNLFPFPFQTLSHVKYQKNVHVSGWPGFLASLKYYLTHTDESKMKAQHPSIFTWRNSDSSLSSLKKALTQW